MKKKQKKTIVVVFKKNKIYGDAQGTGDHLRHIVCIVCLDRFSRKKSIGSF